MFLNKFIQTLAPVVCGLGFVVLGIAAFIHLGNAQKQFEEKLASINAGKIPPDALVVVRKYVDPGKSGLPHIVFNSNRLPNVNLAVTVDLFNRVNPGDTVTAYYFPDGYCIPQNHRGGERTGKWFFLGLGILMGTATFALAMGSARTKTSNVGMDDLRTIIRDRMDGR